MLPSHQFVYLFFIILRSKVTNALEIQIVSDQRRPVCRGDSDPDWTTSETLQGESRKLISSFVSSCCCCWLLNRLMHCILKWPSNLNSSAYQRLSNEHRSHFQDTQFVFFLLLSRGLRSPCLASATTTSRTSTALPSATSSSASCTQRWRTTRSTMPSRYIRLVPILRPWRPRLGSTTLAAMPRSHTHTLSLVRRQMIEKWKASLQVTPSIPPFMCKSKCFAAGRCFIRFIQFSVLQWIFCRTFSIHLNHLFQTFPELGAAPAHEARSQKMFGKMLKQI